MWKHTSLLRQKLWKGGGTQTESFSPEERLGTDLAVFAQASDESANCETSPDGKFLKHPTKELVVRGNSTTETALPNVVML